MSFHVHRHEGVSHPHHQQQTQQQLQQLQPGGMNPPEGRCGTPPAAGSPDRLDKATLKVHLPNGGFNVVKFGDAIDVKVRSVTKLWRNGTTGLERCLPLFRNVR